MQAMADDMSLFFDIALYTDSAAATGIAQRRGLGKTRHIRVALLWLQEKVNRNECDDRVGCSATATRAPCVKRAWFEPRSRKQRQRSDAV